MGYYKEIIILYLPLGGKYTRAVKREMYKNLLDCVNPLVVQAQYKGKIYVLLHDKYIE